MSMSIAPINHNHRGDLNIQHQAVNQNLNGIQQLAGHYFRENREIGREERRVILNAEGNAQAFLMELNRQCDMAIRGKNPEETQRIFNMYQEMGSMVISGAFRPAELFIGLSGQIQERNQQRLEREVAIFTRVYRAAADVERENRAQTFNELNQINSFVQTLYSEALQSFNELVKTETDRMNELKQKKENRKKNFTLSTIPPKIDFNRGIVIGGVVELVITTKK